MEKLLKSIRKLTKEQIKIIYVGAIAFIILALLSLFFYAPQARRFAAIKREIAECETQISDIENLIQGRELSEVAHELNLQFQKQSRLILSEEKDEQVINDLSEQARRLNIEVKDIKPSAKQTLKHQIAGYNLLELPISMRLVSESRDLGEYLHKLRTDFPVLVKFRRININSKCEGCYRLDIDLEISAYLSKR